MATRHQHFLLFVLISAMTAVPSTHVAAEEHNDTLTASWKSGLRLSSEHVDLKIGGRIQNDWAWFVEDNGFNSQAGTEFRRARLYTQGTLYDKLVYKLQLDFAAGTSLKDVYIAFIHVPVLGSVTVGHFKEPFSLDELTSSKYGSFLERALPNILVPGRNTGIAIQNTFADKHLNIAIGVFRDSDNSGFGDGNKGYALTSRITALAYARDSNIVHLGAAARYHHVDSTVAYSARPEAHLADKYITTPAIDVKHQILTGGEFAFVAGSWHAAAEYMGSFHDGASNTTLHGGYAQIGYFFTGESRPYKASTGAFDRVQPTNAFIGGDGPGAWEFVIRASHLDFSEATAGKLMTMGSSLNWYLHGNVRIGWNYILADPTGAEPGHILQTRLQVDF